MGYKKIVVIKQYFGEWFKFSIFEVMQVFHFYNQDFAQGSGKMQ